MAILVFKHSNLSGIERLGVALRDYGHRLRVVSLHEGEPVPVDLDDVDAVVSCGGPQSVHRTPRNGSTTRWRSSALRMIARCPSSVSASAVRSWPGRSAGEVTALDGAMELGWHEVELNHIGREDPLFAGQPWRSMQIQWHGDHVAKVPDGARVLATSPRCVQAWASGLRTYGFQYHPETTPETLMAWAADEPEQVERAGLTTDELGAQSEAHYPGYERLSQRLFEAMALCLMPVDRRYAGIAKDLHH